MNLKFVDILNLISLFQLFLFIIFLLNKNLNRNRISILLLASFFVAQFVGISNHLILSQKDFFTNITPHIFYIGLPFPWLWAPLFYLYVKSLIFSDFKLSKRHFAHLIPFFISLLYDIIQFHLNSTQDKLDLISNNRFFTPNISLFINLLITLQISVYLIFVLIMFYNYKRNLKNRQSNIDTFQNNWLHIFIYGYLIAFLIVDLCRIGLYALSNYREVFVFVSFFGFFIYFILLFYRAISNPEIFTKIEEKPEPKTNTIPKHEAYFLLNRVKDFMHSNEPYLNPELTLKDLSQELKMPERLLSGVINQYNNQNFYDFVNTFRVEKAKKLLTENESKRKTIQEIIWDSGFNSKSTFNLAFKKLTGITPTEFKKIKKSF